MLFDVTTTFDVPATDQGYSVERFVRAATAEQAAMAVYSAMYEELRAYIVDLSAVSSIEVRPENGVLTYWCLNTFRYLSEDERIRRPSWFRDFVTGELLVNGQLVGEAA